MAMDLRLAYGSVFITDLRDTLYTAVPHLLKFYQRLVGGGRKATGSRRRPASGEWVASDGCREMNG